MKDWQRHLAELAGRIRHYFTSNEQLVSEATLKTKQRLNLTIVILMLVGLALTLAWLLAAKGNHGLVSKEASNKEHQIVELGAEAIKGSVKWQNFLEEAIEEEGHKRQNQIELLQQTITDNNKTVKDESRNEIIELKTQLSQTAEELNRLRAEHQNILNDLTLLGGSEPVIKPIDLSTTPVVPAGTVKAPISSYNHLPATSYVSGHLLGGIAVSTSVNTAAAPIPVVIKLTGRGNLPANFAVDLKQCRLLASCYGDISSERAIIRAEELVCEDKKAGLIISTKVAGLIYGDDGANGIRGTVVSMSDKHLKNAAIGGVLSGLASTAKSQGSFNISSLGAISNKPKGMKEVAQDSLLSGASSAAEKLADYHIKLAENISPVILIPGGTKVDIVFTKSVELGTMDVEEVIKTARNRNYEQSE